jgi:hypothetical protein
MKQAEIGHFDGALFFISCIKVIKPFIAMFR